MNIIVDCNYLGYVNRFALSEGLSYRGSRTEIIFGFLKNIFHLADKFETHRFLFCWDSKDSLRRKIYPEYKSNRRVDRSEEEKEEDKIVFAQFDELRLSCLPKLGFKNIFYVDGYESDDLIAELVKVYFSTQTNIVVSSDNDLLQLLEYCSLYNISKSQLTTMNEFIRTHGILPSVWSEVKSISGCSSDNVEGISGVGEKTAIKYLKKELKKGKAYQSIESPEGKKIAERNLGLVALPFLGLPVFPIRKEENFNKEDFIKVFEIYGLSSFLKDPTMTKISKQFNLG